MFFDQGQFRNIATVISGMRKGGLFSTVPGVTLLHRSIKIPPMTGPTEVSMSRC